MNLLDGGNLFEVPVWEIAQAALVLVFPLPLYFTNSSLPLVLNLAQSWDQRKTDEPPPT